VKIFKLTRHVFGWGKDTCLKILYNQKYVCDRLALATGCLQILENKIHKFSRFYILSKQISPLQTTTKCKRDLTNHLSSQLSSFLAQLLQNISFKEHGDWLHPCQSLCRKLRNAYWQCSMSTSQLDVQEISLMSYNIKIAFKNVDK